jgi:hypothetical protein
MGRIYYRLRMLMPTVPDGIFASRFSLAWELVVSALADRARQIEAGGEGPAIYRQPALFIDNLVDAAEALLTAPVSATTQRELALLRPGT